MMKSEGWDTVILSEPSHDHLIAELYFDGDLVAQLDREDGREHICVSLLVHRAGKRVSLDEFLLAFRSAAEDLAR